MGFSLQVDGLGELMQKMQELPKKAVDVAALALYDGAGVVADKVSQASRGIATESFKYAKGGQKRKPSPEEKAIVETAEHGIAKFKKDGLSVSTSVGFNSSGYTPIRWNHAKTNVRTKYKVSGSKAKQAGRASGGVSSKPIPVIVNAINSGTSFMEKQPFLRKAFSQSKKAAEAAIEAGIHKHEDMLDPSK